MRSQKITRFAIFMFLISVILYSIGISSVFALEKTDDTFKTNIFSEDKDTKNNDSENKYENDSENNPDYTEFLSIKDKKLKIKFFQNLSNSAQIKLFKKLSSEDQDRIYLFRSVKSFQQVKIFQSLDKNEQFSLYQSLKKDEQGEIFNNLDLTQQLNIFNSMDESEQTSIFQGLNKAEQLSIFKTLNKSKQQDLFASLSKSEQMNLFENLSKSEQLNLLKVLSKTEQKAFESLIQEEPPSEAEAIFSGQFPKDVSTEISQYGYSFFTKESSAAFDPVKDVPVGDDYIIGPGDSFTINLWGNTEDAYEATVTRDGNITLPRVGTLNVNGLTFADLKESLERKLKEYYPNFKMNITMQSLRTIDIFIVGEAKNPGTYPVSSLSTMITALYASGGPSKNGSLRNIKLMRNGEVIKTLDLYDFFIKGVKNDDIHLQAGDTIFIPVIEPVVGIAGYVKRPAIYEIKGDQTIGDIIELAGGVQSVGYLQNVVVERMTDHQTRIVNSFSLDTNNAQTDANLAMKVQDGDLIKIYPLHDTMYKVVYLDGHVKYPQEYEYKEGMKIKDLIPSYDSLLADPYLSQGEIIRLMPPDLHTATIAFNLGAMLSGDESQNLVLQDQDRVIIYGKWDKKDRPKITINGEVRNPGVYYLVGDMKIKDLIFGAGDLTDKAYLDNAELTRYVEEKNGVHSFIMKFSVKKALAGDVENNILLQPNDVISIREIPLYSDALKRKVILEGEFVFPGEYSFSEGEKLSSVISRAGGLTEEAYVFGAIFQRDAVKETQKVRYKEYIAQLEKDISSLGTMASSNALDAADLATVQTTLNERKALVETLKSTEPTGRMVVDLNKILSSSSSDSDFKLRSGDRLIVAKRQDFINVVGEVYNPTAIFFEKGKSVSDYLDKVGGATKTADKHQIYVVKADGTVISKQQGGLFSLGVWTENNNRSSFGRFSSIKLDPGDSIIVPEKLATTNWLKGISNITQILYQLAVAAQVIHTW
jgi:polysaccharide biosynthesis/export protein